MYVSYSEIWGKKEQFKYNHREIESYEGSSEIEYGIKYKKPLNLARGDRELPDRWHLY